MTLGLIPTAGKATRIHGLPKFLLPVPGGYLLERLVSRMGVPCLIGTHPDNAALMNTYKRPEDTVYQVDSATMCETILTARPYAGDEPVLMGMPDTYWTDENVFHRLRDYLNQGYMCAAAVFSVSAAMASRLGTIRHWHMWHGDEQNQKFLDYIEDKKPQTEARWVWGAMAWTVEFWQYIHPEDTNLSVSMQRAVDDDLVSIPLYLASGNYYDNGVPDDYFRCIRELTGAAV